MFSVYGRSPESKLMSIKPHSLRHLMNTEMFRKNVPDTIITHQFGRRPSLRATSMTIATSQRS